MIKGNESMSTNIPRVEESTKFNFFTSIWIVPFIALAIASWLAYQYFSELGPEIRIVFHKNEGLKAGQSYIKYRDVPIGVVKKIELEENGDGVTVIVRMDKGTKKYLNANTKFWIVKPEVGLSGVSGLDTIFSGTYITMYTKKGGNLLKEFHGMHDAYKETLDGEYFHLTAPEGYNIRKNTPIYFKNLKVGQVEYMNISLDSQSIEVIVFIKKLYVPYVHTNSKFWVKSSLNIDVSNGSLDVDVATIGHLLHGGIAFSSSGEDRNHTVPDAFTFYLYKNATIADDKKLGYGGDAVKNFKILVKDSVAKLKRGALVRYDGFDIGKVKDIRLSYNSSIHKMVAEILLEVDTSAFFDTKLSNNTGEENFYKAVEDGLVAKITPSNPITGTLFVDMVFEVSKNKRVMFVDNEYPIIPTSKYVQHGIIDGVDKILSKLNQLPLESLIHGVNKILADADHVVKGVDKSLILVMNDLKSSIQNVNKMTNKKAFVNMPTEVSKTLKELTRTLKTTKKVIKGYGNNSLISHQIIETLKIVSKTSLEMSEFLKMLNRKPNSLIFGDK